MFSRNVIIWFETGAGNWTDLKDSTPAVRCLNTEHFYSSVTRSEFWEEFLAPMLLLHLICTVALESFPSCIEHICFQSSKVSHNSCVVIHSGGLNFLSKLVEFRHRDYHKPITIIFQRLCWIWLAMRIWFLYVYWAACSITGLWRPLFNEWLARNGFPIIKMLSAFTRLESDRRPKLFEKWLVNTDRFS